MPFIAGIICGDVFFQYYKKDIHIYLLPAIVILFFLILSVYKLRAYSLRWLFGIIIYFFFFVFGFGIISYNLHQTDYSFPAENITYRGIITQKPEYKENSIVCKIELISYNDSITCLPVKKKVLLYFPVNDTNKTLKSGDEIIFYSRISLPGKRGNLNEFDYGRYLIHHHISGTAYIPVGHWRFVKNHENYSLQKRAFDLRDKIVEKYKELGFDRETLSILSALTVGYKEELSEEIRESFSVSGAAHILALSGLHIGFIYGFLAFLLSFLPERIKGFRLLKAVIIISLLWFFAFITGLSPSIVRSVIMFSVFVLSKLITGKAFSFNSLSVAAFVMLVFRPGWLLDVGFQLSFCAVAAILIIQPWLDKKIYIKNKIARYIWGLITVSIAAQIGTAPLVIFYFSRYSTHFLLTNLAVIPIVFVIIHLAVVMLLFTPLPAVQQILADCTQFLIKLLAGNVRSVEQLPFSSIDNIRLSGGEVVLLYLSILLLFTFLFYHKTRYIVLCVISVICLNVYRTVSIYNERPRKSIVFYNVRNCPVVHCMNENRNSWLVYADTLPQKKRLDKTIANYRNRLRLTEPIHIINDYEEDNLLRINNIVWYFGKKIAIINNDDYKNMTAENVLPIDYLYLCNGYRGDIISLMNVFRFDRVVLDTSLPVYKREKLINECVEIGLEYTSIHEGTYIIQL